MGGWSSELTICILAQHFTRDKCSLNVMVRQSGSTNESLSHSDTPDLEVNRISVPDGKRRKLAMESSRGDLKVLSSRTMQVCPT